MNQIGKSTRPRQPRKSYISADVTSYLDQAEESRDIGKRRMAYPMRNWRSTCFRALACKPSSLHACPPLRVYPIESVNDCENRIDLGSRLLLRTSPRWQSPDVSFSSFAVRGGQP